MEEEKEIEKTIRDNIDAFRLVEDAFKDMTMACIQSRPCREKLCHSRDGKIPLLALGAESIWL